MFVDVCGYQFLTQSDLFLVVGDNGKAEVNGLGSSTGTGTTDTTSYNDVSTKSIAFLRQSNISTTITPSLSQATSSSASAKVADFQENVVFVSPQAMPYQYNAFSGLDGTWGSATATQYDPNLLATLSFMQQQPLYFPGADIWGQDASTVSNPMVMNYPLLSPISIDQQQQVSNTEVSVETNTQAPTAPATVLDPASLTQGFSGLLLNGSVPGVMPMGPATIMPNVPGTTPVENIVTAPVGTAIPVQNSAPQPEKPKSWAAIASQPAKPRPPPPKPVQPEPQVEAPPLNQRKTQARSSGGQSSQPKPSTSSSSVAGQSNSGKSGTRKGQQGQSSHSGSSTSARTGVKAHQSELVGKLLSENKYNPSDFTMNTTNARFFVIKSYAEDDIHRSIKYSIWTSTEHGNRRLDQAYREQKGKGSVFLLFSVNGSGHFCGVAQMMSEVDTNTSTGVWAQDKWKGRFDVKWIYVKDVPNSQLRHIRLENNENKPVTNSRDTQEVPLAKAKQVMKIIHSYQHTTSIFDDFDHYEKKQEEESGKAVCCRSCQHGLWECG